MDNSAAIPSRDQCVVSALLEKWADQRPNKTFLEFEDGSCWTFAEALEQTRHAAFGLRGLGVEHGSHVLCWLPNSKEAVLTWFGANYLGAVFIPVNTAYRGRLLQHVIALSDACVLVAHTDLLPLLNDIDTAQLTDIIVIGDGYTSIGDLNYHSADALSPAARAEVAHQTQAWETNYIIFTSGTTGPSKAVQCSYIQAWSGAAEAMFYFGEDDRLLANLPLFHVSGTGAVMDRLIKGGSCVVVDGFSPDKFWDTVRRFDITGTCLVGAMTQFLLKQPESSGDREHTLRAVITVPWNKDSLAVAERYGVDMYTAFNMTELATPIISEVNPAQLGTCGKARDGVEARVVDEFDYEVPSGQTGELILRTQRPWEISSGYYKNPEATASAWRNGWFHTGDAFRRDDDSNFYFVDRIKDAIRRRGENISSFEIESEATVHPVVREAAAIPVPSDLGEDDVMLVVSEVPGGNADPLELLKFLEPRMAHFMLPRYIRVMSELPKTPTQKILKHQLRSEGVTSDTWDREAHGVRVKRNALSDKQ
jgi:crotonobetaine/carnitine-CoA ligase